MSKGFQVVLIDLSLTLHTHTDVKESIQAEHDILLTNIDISFAL